ncbi:MAG TPA: hypothetical protein VEQ66_06345 [Propionibacteriaceae bacterium]|nr:hypothetical protein [Propionibacteriaceae bacterium]
MIGSQPDARGTVPALLLCCALVLGLCAAGSPVAGTGHADFPLDSATVAVDADRRLVRVHRGDELVPGTRVLAGTADSARLADEQRTWLAAGTIPQLPELGDSTMVRDALLDLHVLGTGSEVAVAGFAPAWRSVWPRDSALVAAALARTGHLDDAERVLGFLQRVQPASGAFAARYTPDGAPVSDGREPQSDSLGWALWAMAQVVAEIPPTKRPEFVERHRTLLTRSAAACLALVDNRQSLPPASPDYWETSEPKLTLSTAAMVHAGLVAGAQLSAVAGEHSRAAELSEAATRTRQAIRHGFEPAGYPRRLGGPASSVDLGVSYLLPPFVTDPDDRAAAVWRESAAKMARPAGGLAPGGSWRRDGVSWLTATSSHAMTTAFTGNREQAVRELRWLSAHRTPLGSLPEKVLDDGRPASVAPLAWAAAATLIAADKLADRSR